MSTFIDFHVHPPTEAMLHGSFGPFHAQLETLFGRSFPTMTGDQIAEYYRTLAGRAVLLGWDAETATGLPAFTNRQVADLVGSHPDVFIGFGSVDPHKGERAVMGVHEAAQLGLRGLKFHPSAQGCAPNDRMMYPILEVAEELGLVALFHTGTTGLGSGTPGGMGIKNRLADPMFLDDVAADFPGLVIVMAHPSWPWQNAAIAVAQHKQNVYLELSGWSPKLFPAELVAAVRGPLAERTLFGTDFPFLTPDKWLKDWATLGVEDAVTDRILNGNAQRLLGLEDG